MRRIGPRRRRQGAEFPIRDGRVEETAAINRTQDHATLRTSNLSMEIDLKAVLLRFLDPNGNISPQNRGRASRPYVSTEANGEPLIA